MKLKSNDKLLFLIKKIVYVVLMLAVLVVSIPLLIWGGFKAYDFVFNSDLRSKESYSREIVVDFEYEGKKYTINPTVYCVNQGTSINEGTLRWYTRWKSRIVNNVLYIGEDKIIFFIVRYDDFTIEKAFDVKILGSANNTCDVMLIDDSQVSKFSRLMKDYDEEGGYYDNSLGASNIIHLGVKSENHLLLRKRVKENGIKIFSYRIGDKVLLN